MKPIAFTCAILLAPVVSAQLADTRWSATFTTDRAFIENKGQFDGMGIENVEFAVDEGAVKVLFAPDRVGFHLHEKEKNYYRKRGERDKPRTIVRKDLAVMRWEGSSSKMRWGSGKRSDHHSYAYLNADGSTSDLTGIIGYEELRYESLYHGIDAVYTIHPQEGTKYALHLRPGADAAQIRMRWDDAHAVRLGPDGELRIATAFGEIVDHAPVAHYADGAQEIIGARFNLKGSTAGFALEQYDTSRPIVIDPWTVTPPFPNTNRIWDVEVDGTANVYIYGGDSPLRLRKYSPDGVLQWTYTTAWDTANYWLGSMITHPNGDCFITAGTDPRIARISTAGTQLWSQNGGIFDEYWRMALNCDATQLMLGGTRLSLGPSLFPIGYGRAFEINMANGAVLNSTNVAAVSPSFLINNPNEIRALAPSPNGKYYFMTLDTIGALNPNLSIPYRRNNSYSFSYGVAGYGPTNMGINGIAATANDLYTQNGSTLHRRDIQTGVIIATAAIPGGSTTSQLGANSAQNSGIVIDSCGFVYVGSGNAVHKFNADLQLVQSVTTPGAVYDVAVNYNGEVVACGNGFLMSIQIGSCAPPPRECLTCLELSGPGTLCADDAPVTLTASIAGGTWSGPGITDGTAGAFSPAAAGAGAHVITYTLPNPAPCGADTVQVIVSPCAPLSICTNADGTLTASNGVGPYTWQHQTTTQDCSACILACFFPPGCAVNVTGWTTWATGNGVGAPPNYPIQVIDASGASIVINAASDVPACLACPTISVQTNAVTDVLCFGASTGSGTVQASGGEAPYTYAWSPGGANGAAANGLAAGTYTVTATDANGCTGTGSVQVNQPTALSVVITGTTPVSCTGNDGTATASGGTGVITYAWSPNGGNAATASDLAPGSYTVTATDANGCTAQAMAPVTQVQGPSIVDVTATQTNCNAPTGTITITANGTVLQYSVNGGTTYQATNAFTGLAAGTYSVVVLDANGCQATATATVTQPAPPVPVITGLNVACIGESIVLSTTQPFAAYAWQPGGTSSTQAVTASGNYTVTVTDANGCSGSSAPFGVIFENPVAGFSVDPPSPQLPGTEVEFTFASDGGGGTISNWWWDLGAPGSSSFNTSNPSWTYDDAGVYTITLAIVTENGCTDTVSINYLIRPADIEIPNVFSPNGDGYNDAFVIRNIECFENELAIYNRWGMVVFETRGYRNDWHGANQPEGTYYYVLRLDDGREFTGHLTVLR
ncbi:MAG TPA: gliding motility-associated C-terminal domain-containing protein [Flavobacteriales bacterium]|nr:gliding motility-associated C-terminal domain-containing protein [Flavobacteriales bacterium]